MSTDGDIFEWLPRDLAYVALRLARADELQEHLGRACLNWSVNALELKQIGDPTASSMLWLTRCGLSRR